jgi:hypothetical protein
MEAANANVAGLQQQLYYPADAGYDPAAWKPDTTVISIPSVEAPGDRLIAVDLNSNITRPDYFGESEKGGLRMSGARPWRTASSRSGRSFSAPSPAWMSPWSSRSAERRRAKWNLTSNLSR